MTLEIKVPVLPESVAFATIARWHKKVGDFVKQDELLVDIETDKVVLEVTAPESGVIGKITHAEGAQVQSQQAIGMLDKADLSAEVSKPQMPIETKSAEPSKTSPSVRKMLHENNMTPDEVQKSLGKDRLTTTDVENFIASKKEEKAPKVEQVKSEPIAATVKQELLGTREQRREPMTAMRQRIAQRLVQAQQTAAMLTTFNEVDMSVVMKLRERYKESFSKKHGVKLGFMSFFMKAVCHSLIKFPMVNASIDGTDIVYRNYCDLGVAVSSDRGLVVPVVRDAQTLSLANLEKNLAMLAEKARNATLSLDEMTGGSFTITNGGVFGSLLSTPIINPPQTAILGMHKIQERPIAIDGQVVVRPMMYLALSYDHRLIDGATAVSFLVAIKSLLEEPERFLLDLA